MSLTRAAAVAATSLATAAISLALLAAPSPAPAAPAAAEEATWSGLEQPLPPGASPGSTWPVGLGRVGDIEFLAPNRGLLITNGEAPTIPKGVWAYNGSEWHEISEVCGATDGRIAWAGPGEFWTVSDGRAGQANELAGNGSERVAPLEDNTLCHFVGGHIAGSYAHPAFQADSYQAMNAAACLSPSDCWFAGDPLEEPQIGAFQLHWNGVALEAEPYVGEGHAAEDLAPFEGALYESVQLTSTDRVARETALTPVLHRINPQGVAPAMEPEDGVFGEGLPLYAAGEPARALGFLHLSVVEGSPGERALWAAAGKSSEATNGQVTVARDVEGI